MHFNYSITGRAQGHWFFSGSYSSLNLIWKGLPWVHLTQFPLSSTFLATDLSKEGFIKLISHVCKRKTLGKPRKTYVSFVFSWFLMYFLNFPSNIKVFDQNNVFFELLQQKPCRIIHKFRQKLILEPETCEIGPEVGNRTCPDLPRLVQEDP